MDQKRKTAAKTAEFIRQKRRAHGFSQDQLALQAGTPKEILADLEAAALDDPPFVHVFNLCRALNETLTSLEDYVHQPDELDEHNES